MNLILFALYRCLYLAAVAGAVTYLALDIAPHHASNLIPLAGIAVLLLVALFLSPHPERVSECVLTVKKVVIIMPLFKVQCPVVGVVL